MKLKETNLNPTDVKISKENEKNRAIVIYYMNTDEILKIVKELIRENALNINPFEKYKTRVEIKERSIGKTKTLSFVGLTPTELHTLITNNLRETNKIKIKRRSFKRRSFKIRKINN